MSLLNGTDVFLPEEDITLTVDDVPTSASPGDSLTATLTVENSASTVGTDDPHFCRDANNNPGVAVQVGGALTTAETGATTVQFEPTAFCSTPGEVRTVEVGIPVPSITDDYVMSFSAGWHDPPVMWDTPGTTFPLTVTGDGGGNGGGNGNGTPDGDGNFIENNPVVAVGSLAALGFALNRFARR